MDIKEIIEKYNSGKLDDTIDEKYAGGFWDLAGQIVKKTESKSNRISSIDFDELQTEIYGALVKLYYLMWKEVKR